MSENKDAKQRQIELLFGLLLVTTVASGDFSFLQRKGRDRAAYKDKVTVSHWDAKNRLKYKLKG